MIGAGQVQKIIDRDRNGLQLGVGDADVAQW
jgi:hypothetical protein